MLQAPSRPRELFQLLSNSHDDVDLDGHVDQIDWRGVTPRQIYLGILGRLPECAHLAVAGEGYGARQHALAALGCDEFQAGIIERMLLAYPDRDRLIFIHVPKCAGTDLTQCLATKFPCLHESLSRPVWTKRVTFFKELIQICRKLAQAEALVVAGHIQLSWFMERGLCRFNDRLFTVIRHPIDMAISAANYVLKRMNEGPRCRDPDTKEWAQTLGITEFKRDWPPETLRALALRAFHSPDIVRGNTLCTYLGYGTAASALDLMARCDVEITDTAHYDKWRAERWGYSNGLRANTSPPILTRAMLTPDDLAYVTTACEEDQVLFQTIHSALLRSGKCAVFGTELAR